jgi:hypothetical protein
LTASLGSRKDNFDTVAGDSAFTDDFVSLLKTSTSAYYGLVLKKHMIPLFFVGAYFGWMAVWVLNPECRSRKLR